MPAKIALILGILGLLISGLALAITMVVHLTSDGRIAADEAIWGYLGSCFCSFISLIIAVVGLVLFLKARKPPTGTDATPPTTTP